MSLTGRKMLSRTVNARGDLVITADAGGREEVLARSGRATEVVVAELPD